MSVAETQTADRLAALIEEIGDVPFSTEPSLVRRRSRDYFWYSQVLSAELESKRADVVVTPRNEADVMRVAAAAARHRVPVTPRGAGTGNYGQAVPLAGGVLLDMSEMAATEWIEPGRIRMQPGARMHAIDAELRPLGQELRLHPSTKRTATIGGFVAGGSGGVGSVTWGGLREPGNIHARAGVTLEATPRVDRIARRRGAEGQPRLRDDRDHHRARDAAGAVAGLGRHCARVRRLRGRLRIRAQRCARGRHRQEAADADHVAAAVLFRAIRGCLPRGARACCIAMIARPSLESFKALLGSAGQIVHEAPFDESPGADADRTNIPGTIRRCRCSSPIAA